MRVDSAPGTRRSGTFDALGRVLEQAHALRRRRLDLMRGGARRLLDQLEWEVERVLHLGRLALWTGLLVVLIFGLGASPGGIVASMVAAGVAAVTGRDPQLAVEPGGLLDGVFVVLIFGGGGVVWLAYWLALSRSGSWRWLRYVAIAVDVLSVVRFAAAFRASVGGTAYGGITAQTLAALLSTVFAGILFLGVVRLNPLAAALAAAGAIGGQAVTGALLELPGQQVWPQVALLGLSTVLGMNVVFVLRGMGLKAAQEGVLERFVPQGLTQRIAQAGGTVPARVVPVTILIADIRGFTTLAEPLGPGEAVGLLNRFFATMVGPLAAENAVLDKYLGDGLLAFLEGERHAARGLRAARAMVAGVEAMNAAQDEGSGAPIRMGIAVHTAEAFVGSIGAPTRQEYTIIGDAVNVTSRLEGLMSSKAGAERIDASLIASADAVREAAADGYEIDELVGPVPVRVHGREERLEVYYLSM